MIFVDSNVLIDLLNPDQQWFGWSRAQMAEAGLEHALSVNTIVVAELAANFSNLTELYAALDEWDIGIESIDDEIAFMAGQAFRAYRRRYKERNAILSDFMIGAHAMRRSAMLLTRDKSLYSTYFPDLPLITPETDHG